MTFMFLFISAGMASNQVITYILLIITLCIQVSCGKYYIKRDFETDLNSADPASTRPPLPDDAIQLVSSVASQYPRHCLRVGVGVDWSDQPHVTLHDDQEGREVMHKLKESTIGVSPTNCMIILLHGPPSSNLLNSLTPRGTTDRVFIVMCDSKSQLDSVLLDENFRYEEYVIGIIFSANNWNAFIRKLYTPHGKVEIAKAISWKPGNAMFFEEYPYPEQMKNFYGTKFQATTLNFRPFSDYTTQIGSRVVKDAPCLDVYILREIAIKLNFSYEIIMPEDGLWGTRFENVSY